MQRPVGARSSARVAQAAAMNPVRLKPSFAARIDASATATPFVGDSGDGRGIGGIAGPGKNGKRWVARQLTADELQMSTN